MNSKSGMYCEMCGEQMESGVNFCEACGHPVATPKKVGQSTVPARQTAAPQPSRAQPDPDAAYLKAPLEKRFLAFGIDALVGGLVFGISAFIFLTNTMNVGFSVVFGHRLENSPLYAVILFALVWMLLYGLFRDGLFQGRSLGKIICGLRVVLVENGQPCDFSKSFLRNLTGLMSLVVLLLLPIEAVFITTDPHGWRIGDRWAGTQVVETAAYPLGEV